MSDPGQELNRYAPPTAIVEDVVPEMSGGLVLAGRGTRLAAAIIDSIILFIPLILVIGLLGTVGALAGLDPDGLIVDAVLPFILGIGLFLLLNGSLLARRGQTIGKLLMKIRIVRTDGSLATFGRVFGLRYALNGLIASVPFVGSVYGIVDALMIFRDSRQCLHDQIADTVVVKA
jgi:uncharacterized RDD family membrane protein YckC